MEMTPLPCGLAGSGDPLVAWRIDRLEHSEEWDRGIGAERASGRWNPKGMPVVYCSFDPATTVLEAAVHKGFDVLDSVAHVLTSLVIAEPTAVKVVRAEDVPNGAWLHAGLPSAGQQGWGAALLNRHRFVAFPSVVSKQSWNLVFCPTMAVGHYSLREQARLVMDGRLNPPKGDETLKL
ncbi:MAG: RES family NAD+ phosphorylase [Cyanobium sp.]